MHFDKNEIEENNEVLYADGFEDALIGTGMRFTYGVAIYSFAQCLNVLVKRDGMSYEDAEEYMHFNVLGAYVGENTPIFLDDFYGDELDDR